MGMESSGNNSTSPKGHKHNTRLKSNGYRLCYKEESDLSDNSSNEEEENKCSKMYIYKDNNNRCHLFQSEYINNKINIMKQEKMIKNKRVKKSNVSDKSFNTNIIIYQQNNRKKRDQYKDISEDMNYGDNQDKEEDFDEEEESDEEESDEEEDSDEEGDYYKD